MQGLGYTVDGRVDTEGSALHQLSVDNAHVCRRKSPASWTWVLQRGEARIWLLLSLLLHLSEKLLYVWAEQADGLGHVCEAQHCADGLNARQIKDAAVYGPCCASKPHSCHVPAYDLQTEGLPDAKNIITLTLAVCSNHVTGTTSPLFHI